MPQWVEMGERTVCHVELERETAFVADAFSLVRKLQSELGDDAVYLLESLGGPDRDRERAIVGVDPLLTVEITDLQVGLFGNDALVRAADDLVARASGTADGRLRDGGSVWEFLSEMVALFDVRGASDLRLDFGFLAVFGYDTVRYIEDLPRKEGVGGGPAADITLVLYSSVMEVDLRTSSGTLTTAYSDWWEPIPPDVILRAVERSAADAREDAGEAGDVVMRVPLSYEVEEDRYTQWVQRALEHVRLGDVYQLQLGHEVRAAGTWRPASIYARMREQNPSPFMGYVPLRRVTLLSASPELHVQLRGGGATMRPIAGTAPRSGEPDRDAAAREYLQTAEKEQAEHIMLVDLCRNDLGRIAECGSVRVPVQMAIEEYSHVFHLVSTVTATLAHGVDIFDVIRATFPAGTMTGAPKIRAMELIDEFEVSSRGLYAGAFGVIGIGGFANLALTIRSVVCADGVASTRASAGIVADSSATAEWNETRVKMGAAIAALGGENNS